MTEYTIRPMTRSDLDLAADWAAAEGWNPGLSDADCYWAADPEGFFTGCLDGKPVASISLVKYGTGFGFLGFYIVVPEHRGKGYGLALWQHAVAAVPGRNIGLDGVVDQQDNYKKSGFRLAFRNIRFQGKAGLAAEPVPEKGNPDRGGSLIPLNRIPIEEITAFDRPFFPDDRTRFLRRWITQPGAIGMAVTQNGALAGYGLIRECRNGFKIGPLFAETPIQAGELFDALTSRVPSGADIFLDVPEPNAHALALAGARKMSPCFETARMYTGPFPALPLERTYGITSFEVG